ncbi:MAG: hypothetical protein GY754_40220 [bacterium]|nr:hypothetical protein [bacterium]
MMKDSFNISAYNIPGPSIDKGTIRKKLIEFLESTLYVFQEQFKGNVDTSEEVLNEKLAITLAFNSKPLPFIFQQEAIQQQSKGQGLLL